MLTQKTLFADTLFPKETRLSGGAAPPVTPAPDGQKFWEQAAAGILDGRSFRGETSFKMWNWLEQAEGVQRGRQIGD